MMGARMKTAPHVLSATRSCANVAVHLAPVGVALGVTGFGGRFRVGKKLVAATS